MPIARGTQFREEVADTALKASASLHPTLRRIFEDQDFQVLQRIALFFLRDVVFVEPNLNDKRRAQKPV